MQKKDAKHRETLVLHPFKEPVSLSDRKLKSDLPAKFQPKQIRLSHFIANFPPGFSLFTTDLPPASWFGHSFLL
jgi:hypothetical protein